MKVGVIVECGPEGAETKVIPYLANRVAPGIEIVDPISLDDKCKLRRECGQWVKSLLTKGCTHVLIVWDLLPAFTEYDGRGCRHEDKMQIAESLRGAGLNPADPRIRLVCIEKMMESWILADDHAVAAFLSTPAHPYRVRKCKNPDEVRDPEAALNRSFRETRLRKYHDRSHAFKIIKNSELNRLRRSKSFCRFEEKLAQ